MLVPKSYSGAPVDHSSYHGDSHGPLTDGSRYGTNREGCEVGRCEKLLAKAGRNPSGLGFREAMRLAECYGFLHVRTRGSHHILERPGLARPLSIQDVRGRAKPYQVRQLLKAIEGQEDEGV